MENFPAIAQAKWSKEDFREEFGLERPDPSQRDRCRIHLFQLHKRVVGAYGVHGLYVDGLNHAVSPGSDALLHLHRFHHAHFVPGGHPVSRPNHDGDNFSGHGTA